MTTNITVATELVHVGSSNVVFTPVEGPWMGQRLTPCFRSFDTFEERKYFRTEDGTLVHICDLRTTQAIVEDIPEDDPADDVELGLADYEALFEPK